MARAIVSMGTRRDDLSDARYQPISDPGNDPAQGVICRSAIVGRLDVSLPTVVRIVDELEEESFIRPLDDKEWSGGRRRSLVGFNAESFVVLGIDLGGTKVYGALSDLGGTVLDEVNIGRHGTSGEDSYDRLVTLIDTLLASPKAQGRKARGIGVPGITLHRQGIVKWAYTLPWKDFPLKARLSDGCGLPITIDNDVNLAALGELWFGAGQNAQNMILIALGMGIGAGIIIDRALYRGSTEASGEIGSMRPGREFLGKDFRDFMGTGRRCLRYGDRQAGVRGAQGPGRPDRSGRRHG